MTTFDSDYVAFGPDEPTALNTFFTKNGGTPSFVLGVGGFGSMAGAYGETEPMAPPAVVAGVYGAGNLQRGVFGFSSQNVGVHGSSFLGIGVQGTAFRSPGTQGRSLVGIGVLGTSIFGSSGVTGISATQGPSVPNLPAAGVLGSSADRPGVIGTSNTAAGVHAFSNNVGIVAETTNDASFAGIFRGNVVVHGTLTANVKNSVVTFPDRTQRVLHCMESPEHWFEDFGAAKLKAGRVVVKIDADFARVVKLDEYHVFVTPADDCRGLCVRNKTATSFEVRELADGKSSVAFSYRIVARRKDIKAHKRFAKIDTRQALPARATRPPREPAPTAAALREFVAQLEKEAKTGGRPLPLPTDLSKEFPVSAAASPKVAPRVAEKK